MKLIRVGPVRVLPHPTIDGEFIVARRDGLSHVHVHASHLRPSIRRDVAARLGAEYLFAEAVYVVLASKKVPA